jgi:hypothetical protein
VALLRVYFALAGGEVKIGVATNPLARIKGMQTARPGITLLVDIPGGRELERQLHHRFRKFRVAGEWFEYANEIQDFVNKRQYKRIEAPQLASRSCLEEENFLTQAQLCKRWDCSEKDLVWAEQRRGLRPYKILYFLPDILRIEAEARTKMPKKFTGLRPDQKAELLRREREETAAYPV